MAARYRLRPPRFTDRFPDFFPKTGVIVDRMAVFPVEATAVPGADLLAFRIMRLSLPVIREGALALV